MWVSFLERSNKHVIGFSENVQAASLFLPHTLLFRAAEAGSLSVVMSQMNSGAAGGSRLSQIITISCMMFGSQEADKNKTEVGCSHQQYTSLPQGSRRGGPGRASPGHSMIVEE